MHLEDCPHKMNAVCPAVFRTQHPDLRRRRIGFCCHSSYARMLPEISAKNFPRNSWWAYFYSDGKKRFPITLQALFLSDLEGVIHSRFTLQPPRYLISVSTGSSISPEIGKNLKFSPPEKLAFKFFSFCRRKKLKLFRYNGIEDRAAAPLELCHHLRAHETEQGRSQGRRQAMADRRRRRKLLSSRRRVDKVTAPRRPTERAR